MVLASVSYGQNNSQLGFICVFKTNPNLLEVVAKVNMRQNSAEVFNWDTETFDYGTRVSIPISILIEHLLTVAEIGIVILMAVQLIPGLKLTRLFKEK